MFERMLEKESRPSADEMALYCGECGDLFKALNDHLSARYQTVQEIRFPYGNHYGWCVTHKKFSISMSENGEHPSPFLL